MKLQAKKSWPEIDDFILWVENTAWHGLTLKSVEPEERQKSDSVFMIGLPKEDPIKLI